MKQFFRTLKLLVLSAAIIITVALSPVGTHEAQAAVMGIDVSSYQGAIDWNAVAKSGVKFAMIRIGNVKYGLDSRFASNVVAANAAGIRVGAYVYTYAMTVQEAAADAQLAITACANLPISFPVAIDLEDESQKLLNTAQQQAIVNTFCSAVYAAGYQPMVYSYCNWFLTRLGATAWDHWVANYSGAAGFPGTMWQYSDKGQIPGIAGNVDTDYVLKDYFTSIPANGLVTQNGVTYYYANYRKQFGMQNIGGLQYFFDGTGAMVKNQTVTDAAGNVVRYCKDGHVAVITAAQQAAATQALAQYNQAAALVTQAQASQKSAEAQAAAAGTQYAAAKAAADKAAAVLSAATIKYTQAPTPDALNTLAAAKAASDQAAAAETAALGQYQTLTAAAQTAAQTVTAQTAALAQAKAVSDAAAAAVVIPD